MHKYRQNLFSLDEGTAAKKAFNKAKDLANQETEANDKPAWWNPLTLVGRAAGYVTKRVDQGFNKSYGGVRNAKQFGYGISKIADSKKVTTEASTHLFRI